MWRFHKYYSKDLLVNLSLTFVMLFGITLISLLAKGIWRAQGAGIIVALKITVLWSVDSIPHLLPISLLVGTVFTFGRAAADNEITALRMAGISPVRLMGSVLFVGALTSCFNTYLLNNLIPQVHYQKYRVVKDLVKLWMMNRRSTTNSMDFPGVAMHWRKNEQNRYFDVVFKDKIDVSGQGMRRFEGFAREAWLGPDVTRRHLMLKLYDVRIFRYSKEANGSLKSAGTLYKEFLPISKSLEDILDSNRRHEGQKDVSTAQLVAEYARGGSQQPERTAWFIWERSLRGLASLLFALVGFPIGVLFRRAGRMTAFAVSLLPLAVYYLMLIGVAPWLARETESTWPVLLPDLSLFLIAVALVRRAFRR